MENMTAFGAPYSPYMPRWLPCHRGERWCGWHRMSQDPESLESALKERRAHEETCRGGLILL